MGLHGESEPGVVWAGARLAGIPAARRIGIYAYWAGIAAAGAFAGAS
jgi:hypothetical protein